MINCPIERLRKMSRVERSAHACKNSTQHHKAKLSAADVRTIRHCLATGWTAVRIADVFDVWPDAISRIKRGLSYRDVT